MLFRVFLLAVISLMWTIGAPRAETATFSTSSLEVVGQDGRRHAFTVEVAASDAQLAQGLMFRKSLPPKTGMLFDFGTTRQVAMWMKNTVIPLDMLFITADGRVIHIEEFAVPGSLEPRGPNRPVLGVLELAGGTARRLDLKSGDRVEHAMFSKGR
jgi:uncharacterized membrane protein (UPF0127 family)